MVPNPMNRVARALAVAMLFCVTFMTVSVPPATAVPEYENFGTIYAIDGSISFEDTPGSTPIVLCNMDGAILRADWDLDEGRSFTVGQARKAEFGIAMESLTSNVVTTNSHTVNILSPTSQTSTDSTAAQILLPPGLPGDGYSMSLFGKYWEDATVLTPAVDVQSALFSVVYVDCTVISCLEEADGAEALQACTGTSGTSPITERKATGIATTSVNIHWGIVLPEVTVPASLDVGSYVNDWTIWYRGDGECFQPGGFGGTWYSHGQLYLVYHAWHSRGFTSLASGLRAENLDDALEGRYVQGTYTIQVSGSTEVDCSAQRTLSIAAGTATLTIQGNTQFGDWQDPGPYTSSSEARWELGAISTCKTGTVANGVRTIESDTLFNAPASTLLTATYHIQGAITTPSDPPLTVPYVGEGVVTVCVPLV